MDATATCDSKQRGHRGTHNEATCHVRTFAEGIQWPWLSRHEFLWMSRMYVSKLRTRKEWIVYLYMIYIYIYINNCISSHCAKCRTWFHGHANEPYGQCPVECMLVGSFFFLNVVWAGAAWLHGNSCFLSRNHMNPCWSVAESAGDGRGFVKATVYVDWISVARFICANLRTFYAFCFMNLSVQPLTDWLHKRRSRSRPFLGKLQDSSLGPCYIRSSQIKSDWVESQLMSARSRDPFCRSFFPTRTFCCWQDPDASGTTRWDGKIWTVHRCS